MEKKKKIAIGAAVAVVAVLVVVLSIYLANKQGTDKSNQAYVEKVAALTGSQSGTTNRFAGVIEAQDTWKINLSSDKEVKEVYVKAGDEVAEGDQLFSYNTDEVSSQIEQEKLELESMTNEINDAKEQIASLTAERDAAASEEARFDYSTQIQSVQNEMKQSEYNLQSKQLEIDKLNETIKDSVVTSKMAGVVKSVGDPAAGGDSEEAFMTIMANGSYRVKCYVNEQNMSEIAEGEPMIIRSRVDESQTWTGTLAGIDMEDPQTNSSSDYEYDDSASDSDATTSSKYPFYVTIENTEGLMLGQHVYVELDNGQSSAKEGIWLYEYYLVQEENSAYVWADNGNGKLEKRTVELGEYDEELGEYEIKSGLKEDDYIAWPQEGIKEGMSTTKDASKAMEAIEDEQSTEEDGTESLDDEELLDESGEDAVPDEDEAADEAAQTEDEGDDSGSGKQLKSLEGEE